MTALRSWPRRPSWSKQHFQAEPAAGAKVVVLSFADWWTHYPPPNCGLERTSRLRRWHWPSKDLFRGAIRGVWRFFFSLELPSSRLEMDSSMCIVQKCTFWQRGAEPTCKSPERLLRTSDLDVPTTYHKCVSWVFKSLSRTVRMPQQRRSAGRHERRHPFLELVPRSAHFPSQWHTSSESLQRELRPHCRFLLPVTHALRDEIAEIFGRRTARNTRKKESISI